MIKTTSDELIKLLLPRKMHNRPEEAIEIDSVSIDTRTLKPGDVFVALRGKNFDGNIFIKSAYAKGAVLAIVERIDPYVPVAQFEVGDALEALSMIAAMNRRRSGADFVAVTGSYGKTTVKDMAAAIFSSCGSCVATAANENNIIGVCKTILSVSENTEFVVIEMGTNHPGEIAEIAQVAQPESVAITGIGLSHSEFLGDVNGILREKLSVFDVCPEAMGVFSAHDKSLAAIEKRSPVSYYGRDEKNNFFFTDLKMDRDKIWIKVNGYLDLVLNTVSEYNVFNALAAVALCVSAGIDISAAVDGLKGFVFPSMRMEVIKRSGITYINDAYNANPVSMAAAIRSLIKYPSKRRIAVVADMLELGRFSEREHEDIICLLRAQEIDFVFLLGPAMHKAYVNSTEDAKFRYFESKEEVKDNLNCILKKGDVILLKGSRAFKLETILIEE